MCVCVCVCGRKSHAPKEPSFRLRARSHDCCMKAAHVSASFRSNAVNSSLSPARGQRAPLTHQGIKGYYTTLGYKK